MKTTDLRRIDLLAAEHLLGWKLWLEQRGEYSFVIVQKPGDREPWFSHREAESHKKRYAPIAFAEVDLAKHCGLDTLRGFKPTTDIGDAWKLVEKLNESWHFRVDDAEDIWSANFAMRGPDGPMMTGEVVETADSAPLAITLAALKAKGVEAAPVAGAGERE